MSKLVFLSCLAILNGACYAKTEIAWVKFQVNRSYRDADVNCYGTSARGQLLLSIVLTDGKVTVAQLQNYSKVWPYSAIYVFRRLNDVETGSLRFFQDSLGKWWVTQMTLEEPSLKWALYESGKSYAHCAAPQPLSTVKPTGFSFTFETEGLEQGVWVSESNETLVEGNRKDGLPYTGHIQFTQRQFIDD